MLNSVKIAVKILDMHPSSTGEIARLHTELASAIVADDITHDTAISQAALFVGYKIRLHNKAGIEYPFPLQPIPSNSEYRAYCRQLRENSAQLRAAI